MWLVAWYSCPPYKKDTKYEEWELAMGKVNSWIANSVIPSIGNQLAKFKYLKMPTITWIAHMSNPIRPVDVSWNGTKNSDQGNDFFHDFHFKMTSLRDQLLVMELEFVCTSD